VTSLELVIAGFCMDFSGDGIFVLGFNGCSSVELKEQIFQVL
jgi:hypothetical protein